jgi:hypothetical protein
MAKIFAISELANLFQRAHCPSNSRRSVMLIIVLYCTVLYCILLSNGVLFCYYVHLTYYESLNFKHPPVTFKPYYKSRFSFCADSAQYDPVVARTRLVSSPGNCCALLLHSSRSAAPYTCGNFSDTSVWRPRRWLRRLAACLSLRNTGFNPKSVPVRFVVDKLALHCQRHSTNAPHSFTHLPSTPDVIAAVESVVKQNTKRNVCQTKRTSMAEHLLMAEVTALYSDQHSVLWW